MTRVRFPSAALFRPLFGGLVGDAGDVHVDAFVAGAEGDSLGPEAPALLLPDRQAAVGADDSPPGDLDVVLAGQDLAGEARCAGRDVAVGGDEALGDRADGGEDTLAALVEGRLGGRSVRGGAGALGLGGDRTLPRSGP